jgi:hypothetical protein
MRPMLVNVTTPLKILWRVRGQDLKRQIFRQGSDQLDFRDHAGSHIPLLQLTSTVPFRPVLVRSSQLLGDSPKRLYPA